jgi:hypothetical protein
LSAIHPSVGIAECQCFRAHGAMALACEQHRRCLVPLA